MVVWIHHCHLGSAERVHGCDSPRRMWVVKQHLTLHLPRSPAWRSGIYFSADPTFGAEVTDSWWHYSLPVWSEQLLQFYSTSVALGSLWIQFVSLTKNLKRLAGTTRFPAETELHCGVNQRPGNSPEEGTNLHKGGIIKYREKKSILRVWSLLCWGYSRIVWM